MLTFNHYGMRMIKFCIQRTIITKMLSKTNLLINRKNVVGTPLTTRSTSTMNLPKNITNRENGHAQPEDRTKLYTFCSSENKPPLVQLSHNDENSVHNAHDRERKISLNNLKGKIFEPKPKSKGKMLCNPLVLNKEKKKSTNSFLMLNQSGIVDRRKTDKPNVSRNEDKKINISICINRNGLKGGEQNFEVSQSEDMNDKPNFIRQNNQKSRNELPNFSKEGWSIMHEGGKRKIIIDEEQMTKFTRKCATEKYELQQTISNLHKDIDDYQHKLKEAESFKKDSEEYIDFLEKQKISLNSSLIKLKEQMKEYEAQKQYDTMVKQQYRNTIKEDQRELDSLYKEIDFLKAEMANVPESYSSQEVDQLRQQVAQLTNELKMIEIENNFLKKQLQLSECYRQTGICNLTDKESQFHLKEQMGVLTQTNVLLSNELKSLYMFKIQNEVYKKTVQRCTVTIGKLQEENQLLRKDMIQQSRSIQASSHLSEFQFRLDSSFSKQDCSPSDVEVVWKRQATQPASQREQVALGGYFDYDFFDSQHNE